MRTLFVICLLGLVPACGGGAEEAIDPIMTPEGRACGSSYGSMEDSLVDIMNVAGIQLDDRPEMPDKKVYVEKCLAAGMTIDQIKCLDPKRAATNDACEGLLEPVAEQVKELNDMFADAMTAGIEEEGEGEGEEAGDDAGDAVKDALGE